MAKFRIEDSFNITGQGLVFTGEVLEGVVCADQSLSFFVAEKLYNLRIKGISWGKRAYTNGKPVTGVLVDANEQEFDELYKNLQLHQLVAEVLPYSGN